MNINSAFPSKYIKAGDLNGSAVVVTVHDVKMEQVGRDQDSKPVVYFEGKTKGLVLNRINSKKIADIAGSSDTEDWPGTQIAIFPTTTDFGGEEVECIRVKAAKAAAKPKPATEPVAVAEVGADEIPF